MGINFYLVPQISTQEQEVLNKYGFELQPIHVGKYVKGWQFLFNVISQETIQPFIEVSSNINTYVLMKEVITSLVDKGVMVLQDEYQQVINLSEFFTWVEEDQKENHYEGWYSHDAEDYTFASGKWS